MDQEQNGQEGTTVSTADQAAQATPPAPAQTTTSGPASTPAPTPAAANTPAPAASTTQPGAGAAGSSTPPAQPPAGGQQWANAREYAASLGITSAANYQDDQSFLRNVLAQAQQASLYQSQLQQMAATQAALLQRQQAPAQPAPQERPNPLAQFWSPPEYQPAWEQLLTKDEQGNVVPRPGTPPDVLPKYLAYQQYRRQFADKLLADPVNTLMPMVQHVATQQAQQLVQQHLQGFQDRSWTEQFVAQNSEWLHQKDAMGQVMRHPVSGKPILSPVGQRFQQHVVAGERMGIRDIRSQEAYARTQLQNELYAQQYQQAQREQQARGAVTGANRQPNPTGTVPQPGQPSPPAQNAGLSLRDQLTAAMQAAGINDASLATTL